jgi:hypothetical protein
VTERTPPAWLQAGSYPAEDDRRLIATIFADSEGIILSSDLAVTQRGAGANMSVDVAGGRCVVKGDLATYEGSYFMENRGVTNLTVAAADPTNPRIDRVIAEVLNAEYSGVSNLWRLRVVTGTPAGSPSAPATPSNAISLATIAVAALASSITNANITSTRTLAWIGNGTIICTSTTRPSSPFEGMEIYETDTDQTLIYNGSVWVLTMRIGAWDTSHTPVITQSITVTKTVVYSRFLKTGRRIKFQCYLNITSSGTANQPITITLPFNAVQTSLLCGNMYWFDASGAQNWTTVAAIGGAANVADGIISGAAQILGQTSGAFPNQLASGDSLLLDVDYEATS